MTARNFLLQFPQQLESAIERRFCQLGRFIGRHPWICVLVPLVFGICLSMGLMNFDQLNDAKLQFTPYNSPSRYEQKVMNEFIKETGTLYFLLILILPKKEETSLLEPGPLQETYDLIKYLQKELNVVYQDQNYTWNDLCVSYCALNEPLTVFLAAFRDKEGRRNANFKLRYPIMEIFGQEIYMAHTLHGVKTDAFGKIKSAQLAQVLFMSVENDVNREVFGMWEKKVLQKVNNMDQRHIKLLMNSKDFNESEVRRSGDSAWPFFMFSFIIVLSFTIVTSLRCDLHQSKIWESAAGVIGPLIATAGSFGALLLLSLKFQPIVTVTAFLVLAVGVDDVFLLLRAWHKSDTSSSVVERMGKTLAQAGPSITITSITNALSFAVGILSHTPAIRTFCLYTTSAIIFSYIFQLTFFSALLALSGRREARSLDPCCCCFRFSKTKHVSDGLMKTLTNWRKEFLAIWTSLLVSWPIRIFVVVLLIIYWSIAVWGFTIIQVDLSLAKLLMADSPLIEYDQAVKEHISSGIQQLTVIVNNPGDLRQKDRLNYVHSLVSDFEMATHSEGSTSTEFWLRNYQNHLDFYGIKRFKYTKLLQFLEGYGTEHMSTNLRINKLSCRKNKPSCIKAFLLTTGFRNVTTYAFRKELLTEWRAICDRYSSLNTSVFDAESYLADQTESIKESTKITVFVALLCMAVVCLIFIPNLVSVFCASLCVLSINLGVFGFLTHWGIDLDPISMVSLLMSIGFSIDFTVHMSYHYYKANTLNTNDRLTKVFDSIAWPTLQSGISTLLAVAVMFFNTSYLIRVFAKTVFLVCVFGLIHGLFILPVGLAALPYRKFTVSKESSEQNAMHSIPQHMTVADGERR